VYRGYQTLPPLAFLRKAPLDFFGKPPLAFPEKNATCFSRNRHLLLLKNRHLLPPENPPKASAQNANDAHMANDLDDSIAYQIELIYKKLKKDTQLVDNLRRYTPPHLHRGKQAPQVIKQLDQALIMLAEHKAALQSTLDGPHPVSLAERSSGPPPTMSTPPGSGSASGGRVDSRAAVLQDDAAPRPTTSAGAAGATAGTDQGAADGPHMAPGPSRKRPHPPVDEAPVRRYAPR
jgi:hypothetical protein